MKNCRIAFEFLPCLAALIAVASGQSASIRDPSADTWVATDALGRSLPLNAEVGPRRPDRTVGIFYFLWLGPHAERGGPWDITKILARDPEAMSKPESDLWGPLHAPHHWGESVFGYYNSDDPYVLQKHAQMLSDAGVDMVLFDVTNQLTYRSNYLALLRVWAEVRQRGARTPQVAFLCPFGDPAKVVAELYRDLYQPNLHPELWFRWQGRPLILADIQKLSGDETRAARRHTPAMLPAEQAEIRRFFTFRKPQPDYFRGQPVADMWSWLEVSPQHVFTNTLGQREQISVGVAQNAVSNRLGSMSELEARGRSFQRETPAAGAPVSGANFSEQFERALQEDPRFIFITGWNEWIAGRFAEFNRIKLPVMFVDQFDLEHSRDIEPMKGGHGDQFYYQMISMIRRYKGASPLPPASPPKSIRILDSFDQWSDVSPEFLDDRGDIAQRDFAGYANHRRYVNTSGRNDFVRAKVAADAQTVFFYVQTDRLITAPDGNWMWLLIDSDQNHQTGWEGYDFAVNRSTVTETQTLLERSASDGNWKPIGKVPLRIQGTEMHLAITRSTLGIAPNGPLHLDFKWADHMPAEPDIVSWLDAGDCAPNGRFNYRFQQ